MMKNLLRILSAYGFDAPKTIDIIRLLELAGCFKVDEEFSKNDHSSLENIHNWLIKVTQQEFFARPPGQEVWQQQKPEWIKKHEIEVRAIVTRLGLTAKVEPKMPNYNAAVIFGSTYEDMLKRLDFLVNWLKPVGSHLNSVDKIYLLTGERVADIEEDGGIDFLSLLSKRLGIPVQEIMESHLMQEAYSNINGNKYIVNIPVQSINAPRGKKIRANTVDTLLSLIAVLDDTIKTILFVSQAPNIQSQEEAVKSVFSKHEPTIQVEVVGGACGHTVPLNEIVSALGGTLFRGYERVAKALATIKI